MSTHSDLLGRRGRQVGRRPAHLPLLGLLLMLPIAAAGLPAPVAADEEALGIALEGFSYPYPVHFFPVTLEGQELRLAFMDVPPSGSPRGRTVLLLHGRNFPASYWHPTIRALAADGYRVIAPDQIGFGKSSKPGFDYHFDAMARTTLALLDTLHVDRFDVVGHSMGGMLAVRIARAYGGRVDHLVLYSPIGLEDYRLYVPRVTDERLLEQERALTPEAYRRQLITNYSLTLPPEEIEPFVSIRERLKESGEYPRWLKSFVASYQMIYREPVVQEIPLIDRPTLFIIGANDHVAPGRPFAPADLQPKMGHNPALARALAAQMPHARGVVIGGVGHLAHLEAPQSFNAALLAFLSEPAVDRP